MSYDFSWHARHGEKTSASARATLGVLRQFIPFKSALDIGCGDGRWLAACAELGASDIVGVDGPWTDLNNVRIGREQVVLHDLAAPIDLGRRFDLAMSLEVAEHVAAVHAEQFVRNLTRHADLVLFAAAIPYQGGFRHINEQWQSYWRALFAAQGYRAFDAFRAALWEDAGVHFWYKQNMLLYVNGSRDDLVRAVSDFIAERKIQELPVDIVHPEKYERAASYREIAFKPLLRQLPRRVLEKAAALLGRRT